MNIKSLLLGSAAALVAVSGARAADAVVIAEPEPMEYVRICDTYGAGFYYIPGTETCLKFSGYMRYDIGVGNVGYQDVLDKQWLYDGLASVPPFPDGAPIDSVDGVPFYTGKTNDTYKKYARFEMRVDARQETELGTLRAYGEIRFNYSTATNGLSVLGIGVDPGVAGFPGWTTNETSIDVNHAYIELGGFRAGKTDSYFTTFTGYAGGVDNDGIVPYGPFGTHQLSYTFTGGNGFTAGVALETGGGYDGFLPASLFGPGPYSPAEVYQLSVLNSIVQGDLYAIDSYMPHVVGGVGYTAGWGGISGVVGYDSVWETWAGKLRADLNVNESLSMFIMGGLKDDDNVFNYYGQWGGSWALWGGATWRFNEKTAANVQLSYDDAETFAAVANIDYELVNNFKIMPEVTYTDNFDSEVENKWGGMLRFQYNWGS